MIYINDLNNLISQWIERSQDSKHSDEYKKSMAECAFELQCIINNSFTTEIEARQYLDELYADSYLSTIESQDEKAA